MVIVCYSFVSDYCNDVNISASLIFSANICINIHLTALLKSSTDRMTGE